MDELHRLSEKLFNEVDHLEDVLLPDELGDKEIHLALSLSKRVRKTTTLLTQELAAQRDLLQTQEVTS